LNRRTYGKATGEDIREGYEPTDDAAVVDPNGDEVGAGISKTDDGEGEEEVAESEESRHVGEHQRVEIFLF